MTPATAILFDFGGTLDADGVHWSPRFHAAYRAAGGAVTRAAFETFFKESDRRLERWPGVAAMGFREMVEVQARILTSLLSDGSAIDPSAVAERFHADSVKIVERNRPILERLAGRYRLGVVSNFTGNLEPCLRELDMLDYFRAVTDSGSARVAKPAPAAFTRTLTVLGVPAGDAWMVGDNLENDIWPATALGLRTCWITPSGRRLPPGTPPPSRRIARLPNLERALG